MAEPVCDECGGYHCVHMYPDEYASSGNHEMRKFAIAAAEAGWDAAATWLWGENLDHIADKLSEDKEKARAAIEVAVERMMKERKR